MRRFRRLLFVLPLLAATAAGGPITIVHAQDLTQALTVEEVACNQAQLEALLARFSVNSFSIYNLLVTYGGSGFEGTLVLVEQFAERTEFPEHLLSFRLDPEVRKLLANPRRPPLGQISLTRESTTSNLVPMSHPLASSLTLNPTLAASPPEAALLAINNRPENRQGAAYNGFLATSLRPGRGLEEAGIHTPCHDKLTAFDRKIFALLQRLVRIEQLSWIGGADPYYSSSSSAVIFRDQDPHEYRIALGIDYQYRLRIEWTPEGRLTTARLEMLPRGTGGQQTDGCDLLATSFTSLALMPPVAAGSELRKPYDPRVHWLCFDGWGVPAPIDGIDLAALLADTAWND